MDRPNPSSPVRRYIAYVSPIGTTLLHLRHPLVIGFWSFAFPGSGHILLGKYVRGYLLFTLEIILNLKAHVNLAILYTFLGEFEMAKQTLDLNLTLIYIPAFLFSIWDSIRTTVDINQNYLLAAREDAEIKKFNINAIEVNYLDKRVPWHSILWSVLAPGVGQLIVHRVPSSVFIAVWSIIIVYLSRLLPALHYTFLGEFNLARSVVDAQWIMNFPSVYCFAIYDSYVNTVENNKLFDWELAKFLKNNYQNKHFKMPLRRTN